jgi:NADH:ubiquinone oxidoreductase subunit 3 (subunit A)
MHDAEFGLLLLLYAQPSVLGLALFVLARPGLLGWAADAQLRGVRKRLRAVRFFECAAYARLAGRLRYGLQVLSLCAVFVLYDLDLVFFFAEATCGGWWSCEQAMLVLVFAGLFAAGVVYDSLRSSLMWAL